jgi:hypothetical protein
MTINQLKGIMSGVTLCLVMVLPVGGCGSGGDTATTSNATREPLTRAQFLSEGNGVCRKNLAEKERALLAAEKKLSSQQQSAPSDETLENLAVEALLPSLEKAIAQLGDLPPPAKDADAINKIVGEFEAALGAAKAQPKILVRGEPFVSANKAASDYGLVLCSF